VTISQLIGLFNFLKPNLLDTQKTEVAGSPET